MLRVHSDAKSDLASIDIANKVWLRVLRLVGKTTPSKYELVVDGVRKSGYVHRIETRVGTKSVRFTLILRSKSSKQMASYYGKSGIDIIELNCLPKSGVTTDTILRSLTDTVRGYFVHEFVHYLDARKFKSKKRYEKHVHDIEKQAKRQLVSDKQYFNFDLERNTHYSEIVDELRRKLLNVKFAKRVDSFPKFLAEAKKLQKDFFKNLSDSNKKRVMARLYAMYQLLKGNEVSKQAKALIAVDGYRDNLKYRTSQIHRNTESQFPGANNMSKQVEEYLAIGGVVVAAEEATAAGRLTSLEALIEDLDDARDAKYAKGYYAWVKGGRKGSFPKGKGDRYQSWKRIRSVVNSLL